MHWTIYVNTFEKVEFFGMQFNEIIKIIYFYSNPLIITVVSDNIHIFTSHGCISIVRKSPRIPVYPCRHSPIISMIWVIAVNWDYSNLSRLPWTLVINRAMLDTSRRTSVIDIYMDVFAKLFSCFKMNKRIKRFYILNLLAINNHIRSLHNNYK